MREEHKLILTKPAQRSLQDKVITNNIKALLTSVNTRALTVRGWTLSEMIHPKGYRNCSWHQQYVYNQETEYVYEIALELIFERSDDKMPEPQELGSILRTIGTRVTQPQFGRWTLTLVDGEAYKPIAEDKVTNVGDIEYAAIDIPDDWESYFDHLYGLTSHIERVKRALEAGQMSNWNNRYHCALVGPPGCGKSDICQSIKRALGEEAVIEFDATATTAAGAIKELSEREILPRILLVEEIEKADEKAMAFLLSVLDLRSSIRKVTARSTVIRDTKLFAIATVNDIPLFEKLQAGALASRFANHISFKRPSRDQLTMILNREIERVDGDIDWVLPAIEYCESVGIDDPRRVTAVCLCGREMLLTGEYQKMLGETSSESETIEWNPKG